MHFVTNVVYIKSMYIRSTSFPPTKYARLASWISDITYGN